MLEYIAAYKPLVDLLSYWLSKKRRLTQEEKIKLKAKWKPTIEEKLSDWHHERMNHDVIVHDVKRIQFYPDGLSQKGISPWFRVGLIGTYHDGIMLGLRWGKSIFEPKQQKWLFARLGEEGKNLILIGYIPYHRIEWIDWDGDEFYPYTHLYLHFDGPKRQPYERLALCERKDVDGRPYYTEIADYEEVRKLSNKRGVKYFA
jgi:hypothetical protein